MKLKFVFWIFPVLVFYVDSFKDSILGKANIFVIRILKSRKDDLGILAHEMTHVKNMYKLTVLLFVLSLLGACIVDKNYIEYLNIHNWQYLLSLFIGCMGVYPWLYLISDEFKFKQECAAFKEQSKFDTVDKTEKYARAVANRYGTGHTYEEALAEIRK